MAEDRPSFPQDSQAALAAAMDHRAVLVELALEEDLAKEGDLTARYFLPEDLETSAYIEARESVIVSGIEMTEAVYRKIDPSLEITVLKQNGEEVNRGDRVLTLKGRVRSIVSGERTALNFLQHLSGIASLTQIYVSHIGDAKAQLLDTRKTIPGYRVLEKAAVKHGGGVNHRMGLWDAVMVKDNHLMANSDLASLQEGIRQVRANHPKAAVQLEADTLDQVKQFLKLEGLDSLLLDNMSPEELKRAVWLRDENAPGVLLEASGGITLNTIAAVAETGVDFISVGALTHSAKAADFSLQLETVSGT